MNKPKEKISIVIFGCGSSYQRLLSQVNTERVDIICLTDNDNLKQGSIIDGYKVIDPNILIDKQFDYIVIASQYGFYISKQLLSLGISEEKIIQFEIDYYQDEFRSNNAHLLQSIFEKRSIVGNRRKKIALQYTSFAGSNTVALFQNTPDYIKNKADVYLLSQDELERSDINFDIICNTSIKSKYHPDTKTVQLWHGFPLKKIGRQTKLFYNSYPVQAQNHTDVIASYSELYTALFNASFPNHPDKYEITGMPRNDLLFNPKVEVLKKLRPSTIGKNIIFYMPTYRTWTHDNVENGAKELDNLFGFNDFDSANFILFLQKKNIHLITKLHFMEKNAPYVQELLIHEDVFSLLVDDELKQVDTDLYSILGCADALLTDYSSVYFDTLLIDLPLVFIPTDLEAYKGNRGFNLTPYESWTPGDKCFTQEELEKAILDAIHKPLNYQNERGRLLDILHTHQDDIAAKRVWNIIDSLL